ncbi:Uncharacterized protein SCF082_LOCUS45973, partial [Durusdinium trenchii]
AMEPTATAGTATGISEEQQQQAEAGEPNVASTEDVELLTSEGDATLGDEENRSRGTNQERHVAADNNNNKRSTNLKAIKVLGYENEEQIMRAKALARMGLTEDDMYLSVPYFSGPEAQNRLRKLYEQKGLTDKLPALTGMTEEQILRRKAVEKLGTNEAEIDRDRGEKLASLGLAAPPGFEAPEPSCFGKADKDVSCGVVR